MTISCICLDLEKQIFLRASCLMRHSWVLPLPTCFPSSVKPCLMTAMWALHSGQWIGSATIVAFKLWMLWFKHGFYDKTTYNQWYKPILAALAFEAVSVLSWSSAIHRSRREWQQMSIGRSSWGVCSRFRYASIYNLAAAIAAPIKPTCGFSTICTGTSSRTDRIRPLLVNARKKLPSWIKGRFLPAIPPAT